MNKRSFKDNRLILEKEALRTGNFLSLNYSFIYTAIDIYTTSQNNTRNLPGIYGW